MVQGGEEKRKKVGGRGRKWWEDVEEDIRSKEGRAAESKPEAKNHIP